MIINEEDFLAHYGTPRHSGRYPWGSGSDEETFRNMSFVDTVDYLKTQGLSDPVIARGMGISTTQLRAKRTIENNARKQADINIAERLRGEGKSLEEIGRRLNRGEPYVRTLLKPGARERADALIKTSEFLKTEVASKKYVDIGSGVEAHPPLNISKERLRAAVAVLEEQGYRVHPIKMPIPGTKFKTEMKVLVAPGVTQREVFDHRFEIQTIPAYSGDGGHTFGRMDHPPISINSNRITVRYKEEGGDKADGMIYVRPGIEDISLGKNRYAQVRVLVDNTHYMKGMAVYKNDLPPGTDLLFNTAKSSTGNKLDAMKPIGEDKDYPFGSLVSQIVADKGTPHERVTSAMNLVNEQGSWHKWNRNMSSQMLSKQSPTLAKQQLDVTYERSKRNFDEINALTNPTIKKKLLETFADEADSTAIHLKAAALPRSNWHAILPLDTIPPSQIFAPNYRNGERVVLFRYPHGGTFEIPELTVNNKHSEGRAVIGIDSTDAVGIHHSVAQRLSGADFDGDTVLVIPNNFREFKTSPALEGLKDFNTKTAYPPYDGMRTIDGGIYRAHTDSVDYEGRVPSGKAKQAQMGNVSNLITDMTLKGAPPEHIARAIRHSMVVIDAEKHHLNYKQSAIDNGITQLKAEYQGGPRAGASTLISRKKSTRNLPQRKLRLQPQGGPIDKETGRKVYVNTGVMRRDKNGNLVPVTERINLLSLTEDAHTLSSGTPMEKLYADHSNRMKALANEARLASMRTPLLNYSPSAKITYSKEVDSLNAKHLLVVRNRPLERMASTIAGAQIRLIRQANPNLDQDSIRKISYKELQKARQRTGSKSQDIKITAEEWNAIQAGAISNNKLKQILDKADLEIVRSFATPHQVILMSPVMTARAKSMLKSGYTRSEVADQLGVSLSTLDAATNG